MDHHEFLARVEELIHHALHEQAPQNLERSQILLEGARHLSMAPGAKRARPRLVYSFGKAIDAPLDRLIDVAVSGEFIHAASLLHDDVVDAGTVRRDRPTVNAKWNNAVAVLGGDVMLCISIQLLHKLPRQITHEAVEVVSTMSRAAILEVESRGQIHLPLERWEAIAKGKTGVLFGWCGRAAARLVENEDAAERFKLCGEHLGIAFQLADDLKDLAAPDSGKDRFADLLNRNPSYPMLLATQRDASLLHDIAQCWAQEDTIDAQTVAQLGQRVLATGAAQTTREAIAHHVELAFGALGPYREKQGGQEVAQWASSLAQSYLAETQV